MKIKNITKLLIFFFGVLILNVLSPKITQAGFVEVGNAASELTINSIGLGNYFDMNKLSSVFGDLLGPARQELNDDTQKMEIKLFFKRNNAISFEENKIHSLLIESERGANNILLSTPRNIHVGSSLDEVWSAYGRKKVRNDLVSYYFPKYGSILFYLKNNRVSMIFIIVDES